MHVDKAVLYSISAKLVTIFGLSITALLVATVFTSEIQGFYYTFNSLLALQVFVELGLGTVIIQFASHERSRLTIDRNGRISGDHAALSRLKSLALISIRWFSVSAIIIAVGLGAGGYFFLRSAPLHAVDTGIFLPWFLLCLFAGISVGLIPFWSLLEGCNQVAHVYFYRLVLAVLTNLTAWLSILAGANLWTAAIASAVGTSWGIFFLRRRYRNFFYTLLYGEKTGPCISWYSEIYPMQWRIALSWLSGYFIFSMFTPVVFHYYGPTKAGQMGLTWSLAAAIQTVCSAWIIPKAPQFGMLIAQKKYHELDALFWRLVAIVIFVASSGAIAVSAMTHLLNRIGSPLALRVLPQFPTNMFLLATVVVSISIPVSTYLRAHKQEPLLVLSLLSGMAICASNIVLGRFFGVNGISMGYLLVNMISTPCMFVIWYRFRKARHR